MYDYRKAMLENVLEAIKENRTEWELDEMEHDDRAEYIDENLWCDDGVTGNGSGSYTFSRSKAREYVSENLPLCYEALVEFGQIEELGKKIADEEWEWLDVSIRCYLLRESIEAALVALNL